MTCVTALAALAAAQPASAETTKFYVGEIYCTIAGSNAVRCDPPDDGSLDDLFPVECDLEDSSAYQLTVKLTQADKPARARCAGYGVGPDPTSDPLEAGAQITQGKFRCANRNGAIRCANRETGHGFLFSDKKLKAF